MSDFFGVSERIPNDLGSGYRQEGKHANASSNQGHDETPAHGPNRNQICVDSLGLPESIIV